MLEGSYPIARVRMVENGDGVDDWGLCNVALAPILPQPHDPVGVCFDRFLFIKYGYLPLSHSVMCARRCLAA